MPISLGNWDDGPGFHVPPYDQSTGVYTLIEKANPASEALTVVKLRLKPRITMTGTVRVASFYETAPNVFSTRDWQGIPDQPGVLYPNIGYEIDVNFDGALGDYIGICYGPGAAEGDLWRAVPEGIGFWYLAGIQIPCTDVIFNWIANTALAYGGQGTPALVVPTVQTLPATEIT